MLIERATRKNGKTQNELDLMKFSVESSMRGVMTDAMMLRRLKVKPHDSRLSLEASQNERVRLGVT